MNFTDINLSEHFSSTEKKILGQHVISAVWSSHNNLACLFVRCGADLTVTAGPSRQTALMKTIISQEKPLAMVNFLVKNGADLNAYDKHNNTPLILAAKHGHVDVVKFLLKKGADTKATTTAGYNAKDIAKRHNCGNIMRLFEDTEQKLKPTEV